MKRFTNWPQLFLGLTFNWGALMGWAAVHGALDWPTILPLYASGVAWTLVYDTLYAHQDKKDDKRLGLRSTALTFGDTYTKPILTGFATAMVGGLIMAGNVAGIGGIPFYTGMGFTAAHLGWQIATADLDDSRNLSERFVANQVLGGVIFASIVAGKTMSFI